MTCAGEYDPFPPPSPLLGTPVALPRNGRGREGEERRRGRGRGGDEGGKELREGMHILRASFNGTYNLLLLWQ